MRPEIFELNANIEQRHWWFIARRAILLRLAHHVLPPDPQTSVVDVGCGCGGNAVGFAQSYAVTAIDPNQQAIALAQRRFPAVRFIAGKAPDDLGQAACRARLYLLTDVLEHLQDPLPLVHSLVGAASPGAWFLVTVPADMRLWTVHDEHHGHFRRYDAEQLRAVWNGLPVDCHLLSYFNTRLYPIVRVARTLSRWRGIPVGDAGTDFHVPPAWINRALARIFAGEAQRLVDVLTGRRRPYRRGVSLVALLQKQVLP